MKPSLNLSRTLSILIVVLLFLSAVIILVANCVRAWPFTVDDSFITLRYSKNLAEGHGPTFNISGQHAEGYTSFLWMLIMALPHLANYGVLSMAKLVGLLSMLGTMVWMAVFLFHTPANQQRRYLLVAAGLAALFFGLLPETAIHAVSGMETAGYTFLLTGLVTSTYLAINGQRRLLGWLPLMALLTGLMRPEGNLVVILMLAAAFAVCAERKRFLIQVGLLYILPGALYFLWRWNYFGVLLPLPFYIKATGAGLPGLRTIVSPYLVFLMANLGLFIGVGIFGERKAVMILLLAILPDLFFFLFSHSIMNYSYRFVYPLLPLALILAGLGLAILMKQAEAWSMGTRWQPVAMAWVALFSIFMFAGQNWPRVIPFLDDQAEYGKSMARAHYAIGHALNRVPHDGAAPVLAVTDAGAIPYYSDWYAIDAWGLNDPNIALGRVDPADYVFKQNPEVLVLTSTHFNEFRSNDSYLQSLYTQAQQSGMIPVARVLFYKNEGDTVWVFARAGGTAAKQLSAEFTNKE